MDGDGVWGDPAGGPEGLVSPHLFAHVRLLISNPQSKIGLTQSQQSQQSFLAPFPLRSGSPEPYAYRSHPPFSAACPSPEEDAD
jgi:hypothetical protein